MPSWLVFDLRNSHFAAGFLNANHDKAQWCSNRVSIYARPDTYMNSPETDLAFFKSQDEKNWKAIINSKNSDIFQGYEYIPNLFDMKIFSISEIEKLLPYTLYPLMKDLLKECPDVDLVFIVDQENLSPCLNDFAHKIKRNATTIMPPDYCDDIDGFALLHLNQRSMPREGDTVSCVIKINEQKQEVRTYCWEKHHFNRVPTVIDKNSDSLPQWDSPFNLTRAAIVLYKYIWERRFFEPTEEQIKNYIFENSLLHDLCNRMEKIISDINNN